MLLADLAFPREELAFGHTKIFIRSPRTVSPGMGERGGTPLWGARAARGGTGPDPERVPAPQVPLPHGSPRPAGSPEPILGAPG